MNKKDKLPVWTDEQIEEFSKHIIPLKCEVVVGVDEMTDFGVGKPILCGADMHPGLGCREKFEWGGTHGLQGNSQKNMKFRDMTPPRYEGALVVQDDGALTLPDDYKPHPVTDGGVGSGGARRLADGDSGRRKLVVVDGAIAGAVLGFLPKKFVHLYEQLCDRSYGERRLDASGSMRTQDDGGGRSQAHKSKGRTSSGQVDKTLVASTQGKTKNHAEISMKDERAVDFRRLIDRRLRRLARDIEEFLSGGEVLRAGKRRCGGRCRKIGEPDWLYCPRCGGPMQEEES